MDDDQQFCLRWNNHQSTLVSVFDNLLESETLVDCTLAAEGKILKAHKVVLSACSPYFAKLLQEQYDKHPIFILKDVKFQELRAMMDYMYRGEVNISQDQLAALLKAAESLQIKGLSDNRSGVPKPSEQQQQQQQQQQHRGLNMQVAGGMVGAVGKLSAGYTLEQTKRARVGASSMDAQEMSGSREGSSSPSRRRRKIRRRSIENAMSDVHDSNSSQMQANLQANANLAGVGAITAAASALAAQLPVSSVSNVAAGSIAAAVAAAGPSTSQQLTTSANKKTESAKALSETITNENQAGGSSGIVTVAGAGIEQDIEHVAKDKANHKQKSSSNVNVKDATEMVIEPKNEYDEEANEETVEDLTLDDEEMGMDDMDHNAGTSQGGEGSSQGYTWPSHDRSQDELLMTSQEAQQRDPQAVKYEFQSSMSMSAVGNDSMLLERFPCAVCGKSYLRKRHLQRHMRDECIGIPPRFSCELCPSRFRRKYHMVRHLTSKHGIPQPVAQQTTGSIKRAANNGGSANDSSLPENLSMKKELNENVNVKSEMTNGHNGCAAAAAAVAGFMPPTAGAAAAAAAVSAGNVANDAAFPQTSPTTLLPISNYQLTGAISAISAAAAVVENASNGPPEGAAAYNDLMVAVKNEPLTPNKAVQVAAAMDEDWKMKLSLQLISNSLLKERLMNTMPFAYNNN